MCGEKVEGACKQNDALGRQRWGLAVQNSKHHGCARCNGVPDRQEMCRWTSGRRGRAGCALFGAHASDQPSAEQTTPARAGLPSCQLAALGPLACDQKPQEQHACPTHREHSPPRRLSISARVEHDRKFQSAGAGPAPEPCGRHACSPHARHSVPDCGGHQTEHAPSLAAPRHATTLKIVYR